ncbi:MAG: 3-deoxy-7-phosphoheptulonate synthase, partial [Spirochaetaceae bacterium]|nr:3-deoxy-7-phosphoheptulonate synthase [Spirochaetaceae bacterium]
MEFERRLAIPAEVKEQYPVSGKIGKVVEEKRAELKAVFEGRLNRLLLIIGPCSADNEDAVLEYMNRLVPVQEKVRDKILMVPRIYTNKPRTTGAGYKGMLHQPDPNAKPDLYKGIVACRHMHMRAVEETGFIFADEMLYPENYQYLDDLLGYVAVGARSVEDQQHRLTSSGFDVATGMKNPTSGHLSVMLNSIYAAQQPHSFIFRGNEVETSGNPLAHAILRGAVNKNGSNISNYHYEDLALLLELYQERNVVNPACIIDANHNNSGKRYAEQ